MKVNAWTLDAKQATDGIHYSTPPVATGGFPAGNSDLCNLQGRRLAAVPQKGLYILNGKKYVRH